MMRLSSCGNGSLAVLVIGCTDIMDDETYPPRIVQLKAQWRIHLICLSSQVPRQPPISIHHYATSVSLTLREGLLGGILWRSH